jgi:hypothetical protein
MKAAGRSILRRWRWWKFRGCCSRWRRVRWIIFEFRIRKRRRRRDQQQRKCIAVRRSIARYHHDSDIFYCLSPFENLYVLMFIFICISINACIYNIALLAEMAAVLTSNPFAFDLSKAIPIVAFISAFTFTIIFGAWYFVRWDRWDHDYILYSRNEAERERRLKMAEAAGTYAYSFLILSIRRYIP